MNETKIFYQKYLCEVCIVHFKWIKGERGWI